MTKLFRIISFPQKTSFPLEIAARFQLNLMVTPIPRFNLYRNVPRKFMPILWFEQHVVASSSVASMVKLVLAAPTIGQVLGVILLIIGLICMISVFICTREKFQVLKTEENPKTEILMTNLPEARPLVTS